MLVALSQHQWVNKSIPIIFWLRYYQWELCTWETTDHMDGVDQIVFWNKWSFYSKKKSKDLKLWLSSSSILETVFYCWLLQHHICEFISMHNSKKSHMIYFELFWKKNHKSSSVHTMVLCLSSIIIKGLRMVARALWRSEARRVVPWSETLHEP